jgi:hypothetical protein
MEQAIYRIIQSSNYLKKKREIKMSFTGIVSSISARLFPCATGIKPSACVTLNFDRLSARSSSRNHTLGITVHK